MWTAWLRQAAWQAGQEKLGEWKKAPPGPAELPPPDAAVLCALEVEAGALIDRMARKTRWQGEGFKAAFGLLGHVRTLVFQGGVGSAKAARAAGALLSHRPPFVISAGLCGGLAPETKREDLYFAERVIDKAGRSWELDLRVDRAALLAVPGRHVGTLLTNDRVVGKPAERKTLFETTHAGAVDMETAAVAEACAAAGVPLLAVRIVSDGAAEELPAEVEKLLAQKSTMGQVGAAFGAIWKRPGSLQDMFRLQQTALECSDRLAKFLEGMLCGMVPPRADDAE